MDAAPLYVASTHKNYRCSLGLKKDALCKLLFAFYLPIEASMCFRGR